MMMARLNLLNSLPRFASIAPFLCLIVAQCEWPDMAPPSECGVRNAECGMEDLSSFRIPHSAFRTPSWLCARSQELEFLQNFSIPVVHSTAPVALVEVCGALEGRPRPRRQVQPQVDVP